MDETAPNVSPALYAQRITREAWFVVLSTAVLFAAEYGLGLVIKDIFGHGAAKLFLYTALSFAGPLTLFGMESGPDNMMRVLGLCLVITSPIVCLSIVMGWRSCVRYEWTNVFSLSVKTSAFASFFVTVLITALGVVSMLVILSRDAPSLHAMPQFDNIISIAAAILKCVLGIGMMLATGFIFALPSAVLCATFYMKLVRPMLLRAGIVDVLIDKQHVPSGAGVSRGWGS